jgi:hypothetical protein
MRARLLLFTGLLLIVGVVLVGAAAPAEAQGSFAVSSGFYRPEAAEQPDTESFGVRGGYRIRPNIGFEWDVNRVKLADTVPFQDDPTIPGVDFDEINLSVEIYNVDVSVQWFPRGGNLIVFGGPGVARIDSKLDVTFLGGQGTETDNHNVFTAHAGVGYAWQLGGNWFVRPEARVRHYFGYEVDEPNPIEGFYYSYKATDYQAGVIFGWRFGSLKN